MRTKKWWDAHRYLAGEIAECADELVKHQRGYPGRFDRISESRKSGYSKRNEKRWRDILITIRDGFRVWHDSDGDFHEWKDGKEPPWQTPIKQLDGIWLVPSTPPGFKLIVNKRKKKRFEDAMRLFVEYFGDLWD